jgi:hypothetical protein
MSAILDPIFGCELVTHRLDRDGYAFHGSTRAHLHAWRSEHGEIPEGMEVDHLCRRRNCRALHHLELVTRSENELRKSWRYRAKRKRCAKGHDMWDAKVTPEGGRLCRTCDKEVNDLGHREGPTIDV